MYDLFEIPEGYITDLALVIAPYFDPKFARQLIRNLEPRRIRFIVDDGARPEDVKNLERACGRNIDVKVALGAKPRGVVHLKCFYFEFVRSEGRQLRKRRLMFGSANATEAAFSGNINAELIAEVDLSAGNDRELLEYLNGLVAAVNSDKCTSVESAEFDPLQNSPTLYLPSFKISPVGPPPGFDSWLQRGLLVAKYKDSQQFLNVSIRLNSSLPMALVEEIFSTQNLMAVGPRNMVRYPYIDQLPAYDNDEDTPENWRARYCLWTHFGEWLSDECYSDLKDAMKSRSSQARQDKVEQLLNHVNDEEWKNERRQRYLNTLSQIWLTLENTGIDPANFLKGDRNGIDERNYRVRFDKKIEADICLAQDADFYNRYVNGYEFPRIPRFRQDTPAWESFAHSFCESIALEETKSRSQSLIFGAICTAFNAMELELAEMASADILKILRKSWNKPILIDDVDATEVTVGEHIAGYF